MPQRDEHHQAWTELPAKLGRSSDSPNSCSTRSPMEVVAVAQEADDREPSELDTARGVASASSMGGGLAGQFGYWLAGIIKRSRGRRNSESM